MAGNATAAYVNETIAEKTLINGLYYRLTHSAWPEMGIADIYDAVVLPKAEQSSNSNYVSGSITIPNQVSYSGHSFTVSTISDNAFYKCTNLTSITVNSSLIAIGKYAFYGCSKLQDITINSSDISFNGEYIFSACGALKNVTFTQYNSVSNFYVADEATAIFYGCSNLKSIVLPAACEKVTNYFFGNCSSLEYVFFGAVGTTSSLLNSMEANVFYQCGNVRGIYINKNGAAPSIQSNTFSGIPSSAHVYVPCNYVSNYNSGYWSSVSVAGNFPYAFEVLNSDAAKGSITVTKEPDCDNTSAQIAAYPYAGYAFEAWYDVDNNLVYSYEPITSIANVNRDMNLQAYFVEADCSTNGTFPYRLDVESANAQQGAVAIYKIPSCDDPSARISASGFAGYIFEAWVDVDNGNVVYSYEPVTNIADVNRDMHLVAHFVESDCEKNGTFPYMFTAWSNDENMGMVHILKTPDCDDKRGTIGASANSGYRFVTWSDGNQQPNRFWDEVKENVILEAVFAGTGHSCESDGVFGYLFQIESNDLMKGTALMTRMPDCADNTTTIMALAKEGYEFVRWSDGDKNAMRTVTVSGDIYLQALFQDPANPLLEDIEEVIANDVKDTRKVLIDGTLYIVRDGKVYTAQGARVK